MAIMLLTGKEITELRKRKGMTLRQFGEMLGVAEATVSRWESESRHPRINMYRRLYQIKEESDRTQPKKKGK